MAEYLNSKSWAGHHLSSFTTCIKLFKIINQDRVTFLTTIFLIKIFMF